MRRCLSGGTPADRTCDTPAMVPPHGPYDGTGLALVQAAVERGLVAMAEALRRPAFGRSVLPDGLVAVIGARHA